MWLKLQRHSNLRTWGGHFSHFTIVYDASKLVKRHKYFGRRYAPGIQRWGFDLTIQICLQDLGEIKFPSFSVSYIKVHEYHFLFSSSQFRVFKAFKYPNSPTIRSFITLSKSLQISSRISKISSCFSLHKFSLRISLYLLRKPPRPVIFSSTYLELVGLSV